ncbi:MAG TPA: DNA repair protein RecN, partial [Abditibacteriaceae bacterium]|nr:DNA repair protein RecN [Abditibacteriaceae bacterium]
GETGAGKSILIQALALLVGERAAAEHVGQSGAAEGVPARALVEGSFDVSRLPQAITYLNEQDIPLDDAQLIITREISTDSRSRVRINGRLATAATLRELGGLLVDLHGQHEHQLLLRAESHLGFLDAFGDAKHAALRSTVREKYEAWRTAQRRLDEVTRDEQQRAQRLDMLQFQADEIDAATLQPDEDTELMDERARLMNAEKLRDAASLCRDALLGGDEPGALVLARQALKAARDIEAVDGSVAAWVRELESAIYELEDAAAEAREYTDTLEADPLRLEEIEARLQLLNRLKRKYGDSLERVIAYRAEIESELQRLNLSEEELSALREASSQHRAAFVQQAEELSQARYELAQRFCAEVVAHLQTLAMERTRFEVNFERDEGGSPDGIDRIEFLISANPGQPLRPLARIASGGEISRVMLALRSVLSNAGRSNEEAAKRVPIIVFDEIDTGIGGVTAEAVGEKMQELAHCFQVFCVTHLPQIARRADRHYRVLKESDEERTNVSVNLLKGDDRVRELARMMGRESQANLRHARELLKS